MTLHRKKPKMARALLVVIPLLVGFYFSITAIGGSRIGAILAVVYGFIAGATFAEDKAMKP